VAQTIAPSSFTSAREMGFGKTSRARRGVSLWKGIVLALVVAGVGYGAYRMLAGSGGPAPAPGAKAPAAGAAVPAPAAKPAVPAPGGNGKAVAVQAAPTPAAPAPVRQTPGRALYGQGQWAQAATKLVEEAAAAQAPEAADLLTLAGDCHAKMNNAAEAEKLWARVVKDYAAQPSASAAALRYGDALVAKGEKVGARAQYAVAFRGPQLAAPDRDLLAKKMIDLNQELLFSRKPTPDSVVHAVQPGENLTTIGRKYKVEPNCVLRVNGMKNANLYPSDKLKIPQGTFRLAVSKARRLLWLFYDDSVAKQYEVAIGKEGHDTPVGDFAIAVKEVHPNWTRTTEDGRREVVPYGAPGHMLGSRWMGFAEPNRDIGIHGTPKEEESKIGGAVSKGCVRMRNAEVEELFDLVPKGTKVTVSEP
jgi:lipoprotein-anchoring transpeptidase ErfK/SrfK